ncbi:MAG TPA: DUF308 domain-containing protein [Nitrososphaeraceae archaeon]|nr:DUF308 domain-containing protein [Nitrososphaeraceae archaeon]
MSETKSPGWLRAAQIGLGIIALILSIYVLVFPGATIVTIVFIIGIILFVVGIERIIVGIFSPGGRSRWGTVGLGILVLIIAGIAMAFPVGTSVFVLFVLSIALLFDGIARLIHGFGDRSVGKGSRIFSIVAGAIEIGVAIMIMVSPFAGAVFLSILLSIALLIVGIQIIVAGVTGTRFSVRREM